MAISIAISVGCLVHGFQSPLYFFFSLLAALAAIPYWQSIRWVDAHGSWDEPH